MLVSENLYFDPKIERYLCELGLNDYDAIMGFRGGRVVGHSPEKHVRLISLDLGEDIKRFYLKQAFHEHPINILKSILKEGRAHVITDRELHMLKLLESHGVQVMHPVAWGKRSLLGIPLSGFLMVEEVQGKEFVEMYKDSDGPMRRLLMGAYGSLVGFMHSKGLDSIVRVTDMICVSDELRDHKKSIVLIDREWGSLKPKKISFDQRCHMLGKMFVKMVRLIGVPTVRDVSGFIKGYLHESQGFGYSSAEVIGRARHYALQFIKGKKIPDNSLCLKN